MQNAECKMNCTIRSICSPSTWAEFSARLASFQTSLFIEELSQPEPMPYWKDPRFLSAECSFSAPCTKQTIQAFFPLLCNHQPVTLLTDNENEIELGALTSIPELLANPDHVFVICYACR